MKKKKEIVLKLNAKNKNAYASNAKLLPPLQKKELVLKLNVLRTKESKMSVVKLNVLRTKESKMSVSKLIAKNKNVFV